MYKAPLQPVSTLKPPVLRDAQQREGDCLLLLTKSRLHKREKCLPSCTRYCYYTLYSVYTYYVCITPLLKIIGVYTSEITAFYAAIKNHSLERVTDIAKKREILNTYYKFMIYRNPAERLFSAYRDKVEKYPMLGLEREFPHFNWVRRDIFEYKYPERFQQWNSTGGRNPVNITFVEFVDYWINHNFKDAHFSTIFSICQPCQVHYHYYGKFSTLKHDVEVLMRHVGADLSVLDAGYYEEKGKSSSSLAPAYYNLLNRQQKKAVVRKLAMDLLFYYSIFPEERDSHKLVMDTDIDVPSYGLDHCSYYYCP